MKKGLIVSTVLLASMVAKADKYLVRQPASANSVFAFNAAGAKLRSAFDLQDLNDSQVRTLRAKGYRVEKDQKVYLHATEVDVNEGNHDWAMRAIRAPQALATPGSQGAGITVCVLDSGVDAGHPQLHGAIAGGVNISSTGHPSDFSDSLKHGTWVSSIIAGRAYQNYLGVAPQAQLYVVKVFAADGTSDLSRIITGIRTCFGKAQVINMSFGGAMGSDALEDVLREARGLGISLIAAAGNGSGSLTQPASSSSVLAVGAVNADLQIAPFSNRGPEVDFVAPGVDVDLLSSEAESVKASGTSFSSAYVAGIEALRLSRSKPALKATDLGFDPELQGAGLIDAFETVR